MRYFRLTTFADFNGVSGSVLNCILKVFLSGVMKKLIAKTFLENWQKRIQQPRKKEIKYRFQHCLHDFVIQLHSKVKSLKEKRSI